MTGLRPVPDDGEAPRGAPGQQHLPLGIGQLLCLVHHDMRERARQQVRLRGGRAVISERCPQVLPPEHGHHLHVRIIGGHQLVHDLVHELAFGRGAHAPAPPPFRGLGVTDAPPGCVQQRQVGEGPGTGVGSLQGVDVPFAQPRSASGQVAGHGPEVRDDVSGFQQRPHPVQGPGEPPAGGQPVTHCTRPAAGPAPVGVEGLGGIDTSAGTVVVPLSVVVVTLLVAVFELVRQDRDEGTENLIASLVVGRARVDDGECLLPVAERQDAVAPGGFDQCPARRCLFVDGHCRLDRPDHAHRGLQPFHPRVRFGQCLRTFGHKIRQRRRLDSLLPQAGQHIGDVVQVGPVRPDEEHSSAAVSQARIGVEQVGGAVQGDDRLARARSPVHDQHALGPGPDDRILVGVDRTEHVAHPIAAATGQTGDECRLVIQRCGVLESRRREGLIPVVDDLSVVPAVPAAAGQPPGIGVGGAEEWFGGR